MKTVPLPKFVFLFRRPLDALRQVVEALNTVRLPGKSRHPTNSIFCNVRVHLGQNSIEFRGGQIVSHLLVPLVIVP